MTADTDVVGRIREDEIHAFSSHQLPICILVRRVTANQQMLSKLPKVAHATYRGFASAIRHEVFRLVALVTDAFDNQVGFGRSRPVKSTSKSDVDQVLKLDGEHLVLPTGLLRESILRKYVGPLVGFAEMR